MYGHNEQCVARKTFVVASDVISIYQPGVVNQLTPFSFNMTSSSTGNGLIYATLFIHHLAYVQKQFNFKRKQFILAGTIRV